MKVIPRVYGQNFSRVLDGNQRYTGNITIVPDISFRYNLKVLTHPSFEDMTEYILRGEQATWDKISRIQNMLLLERTLEECLRALRLEERKSYSAHSPSHNASPSSPGEKKRPNGTQFSTPLFARSPPAACPHCHKNLDQESASTIGAAGPEKFFESLRSLPLSHESLINPPAGVRVGDSEEETLKSKPFRSNSAPHSDH
jgi:hypothetical protein